MIDDYLGGLFDYAGMFPPASLSLEDTLAEAATFPDTLRRPGMVSNDLVLTPDDWATLSDDMFAQAAWKRAANICIVGVDATQATPIARRILDWNAEGGLQSPPRRVTTLEVHVDPDTPLDTAVQHITALRHLLVEGGVRLFLEPKWDDATWQRRMDELWASFDKLHDDTELPPVGLKFRCAGPNRLSPETIAMLIPGIDERAIPLKATQGLHHPIVEPRYANDVGFLGLLAALRIHDAADLPADERVACLTETDPGAFRFEDGVRWRDHHIGLAQWGHAARVPFSIGSCSLREPDDDLARLYPTP